jgi:hypothetical protein
MKSQKFEKNFAWDQISEFVEDVNGWSPIEQLYSLYLIGILTQNLKGDIVEIGAWGGRSTIALALSAKNSGHSIVHSIDYFPNGNEWAQNKDGSYSFNVKLNGNNIPGYKLQTVWKKPFEEAILPFYKKHPNLFKYYKENIRKCGLTKFVKPFRGNSSLFAKNMDKNFKCRLVYIDGEHSYEGVKADINSFKKHLVKNGAICFDDAFTCYDGVDKAIKEMIINSGEFHSFNKLTRKLFVAFKK